jgi:hypothetical protein
MTKYLDPTSLGLPSRTIIEEIDRNTLAIVIKRKSRIIMADGEKILEKVLKIKETRPGMNVILKTNTPICSKTLIYFTGKGFKVTND